MNMEHFAHIVDDTNNEYAPFISPVMTKKITDLHSNRNKNIYVMSTAIWAYDYMLPDYDPDKLDILKGIKQLWLFLYNKIKHDGWEELEDSEIGALYDWFCFLDYI